MPRLAPRIELDQAQRHQLERVAAAGTTPQRTALRCQIVLRAADGLSNAQIAAELGTSGPTAARWRSRYLAEGFAGIAQDKPRLKPASMKVDAEIAARVVELTLHTDPPGGETHWSTRLMARVIGGISHHTVWRIWQRNGLKPHQLGTFKLSRDPNFVQKLHDVVGLYLNPPEHAVVFSADEKSQCQALERTQQYRINFDRPARRSHDYKRHGTTTLFAALCTVTGRVVHRTERRHTHVEWLRFLRQIDSETDPALDVHIICDNYGTHKHAKVREWLASRPRFHIHFTPTSASWMNLVERFFSTLTTKVVRRGSWRSVAELERALARACETHNTDAGPYRWVATPESILRKLRMTGDDATPATAH
jgi:transposase